MNQAITSLVPLTEKAWRSYEQGLHQPCPATPGTLRIRNVSCHHHFVQERSSQNRVYQNRVYQNRF